MTEREAIESYLAGVLGARVELLTLRPLKGAIGEEDPKGFGYGMPLEIECLVGGELRSFVMARTRPERGFGHDYPGRSGLASSLEPRGVQRSAAPREELRRRLQAGGR